MMSKALVFITILMTATGCASHMKKTSTSPSFPSYFNEAIFTESDAFALYQNQPQGEQSKIRYLINLVRYSTCKFQRNGEIYSSDNGARWLEYKLNLYPVDSQTAKDFVEKTAAFSRKTGKDYEVIFPNKASVSLKRILKNELDRLEAYEAENRANLAEASSNGEASVFSDSEFKLANPLALPAPSLANAIIPPFVDMATVLTSESGASQEEENT